MKEITVKIPVNEECDTKTDIQDLIIALLEASGNRFFAIESIEIDGEKVFGLQNPNGFKKEFFKNK